MSRLTHQIEQHEALVRDKRVACETERASIADAFKKLKAKAKRQTIKEGELEYLGKRIEAIQKQHDDHIAALDAHVKLLDKGIHDNLEKMHGLLAYGLANGGLGSEMRLLHDSLSDFLTAKTDSDRNAAQRTAVLCLEHGTLTKADKPNTPELDQFEALEGEDASTYWRKHEATIKRQLQVRIDDNNQL